MPVNRIFKAEHISYDQKANLIHSNIGEQQIIEQQWKLYRLKILA